MSAKRTQWHPLFAHLLGLLVQDYYEVRPEEPVSELPRRGDILLLRRLAATPPFRGLWSHLTEVSVLEFKGPGDDAESDDLELLIHVGTGLTYKLNEERAKDGRERVDNHEVSFWYLVPKLSERFVGQLRLWASFDYQTGGVWTGRVWGHPLFLVSYTELVVEEDAVPLLLLGPEPGGPRELGEKVAETEEMARRFLAWLRALKPDVWEKIRVMASTSTIDGPRLDWEKIGKYADLSEVVRVIPPERVIELLGVQQALDALLTRVTPEQLQEMLRRHQSTAAASEAKPPEGPAP